MASSRSLGTLTLDLIAKLAGFEQGMDQASRKTDATARQIERRSKQMQAAVEDAFQKAAVGAGVAIAGLAVAVGKSIEGMYNLVTLSKQVAVPIDQFSAYVAVANNAEVSTEDFTTALKKLSSNMVMALQGSKQQVDFFKAIGISVDQLKQKNPAEVWLMVSDALAKYKDNAVKVGVEQGLLGRSGSKLNDLMNMGSKAIQEQSKHMKDLGLVIDQNGADKLSKFDDSMDELKNTVKGLSDTLAIALLPTINDTVRGITNFIQSMNGKEIIEDFAKAVKLLVDNLASIAVFFATRFVAAGAIALFGAITSSATVAAGAVAAVRIALAAMGGIVGLAATAIAALTVGFYNYSKQVNPAKKSTDDLRAAIEQLQQADKNAVGPAEAHAKAVLKIAQANLVAANAELVRLKQVQDEAEKSKQKYGDSSIRTSYQPDVVVGPDGKFAPGGFTNQKDMQARVAAQQKAISDLQKQIDSASKAIDTHGLFAGLGPTNQSDIKIFDSTAAAKAKAAADALAKAVASLYEEVQNINAADDPSAKITQDYANRIRHVAELGAAVIKAGGNVQEVQAQVAAGAKKLNEQMQFALDAPKRAVQEYTAGLDAQLKARQNEIDLQVQSIGLGDKEASQMQELTKIRQDAAAALSKFTLQHQLNPNAMSDEQYQAQLAALKKYWDDYYNITADGQKRVDKAQASWQNGVQKSIDNFMDGMRNGAQQGQQFMDNFISGIGDAFVQVATGAETAKKAFGDFIDQLFADALRFVANKAIQALFDTIGGGSKQDAGTSQGWGNLFSNLLTVFGGGKAGGGLVAAGTMYRVNEGFGPEMLSVGGRDYLMMGAQAGYVTSAAQTARTTQGNTQINVMVQPTSTRRTAQQVAQEIDRKQRTATARNS